MSPRTMRRLEELSLSPKKKYSISRRTSTENYSSVPMHDNYTTLPSNGLTSPTDGFTSSTNGFTSSYTSLTSSEPAEDYWPADSEETLV
jgi:hypothetical protein